MINIALSVIIILTIMVISSRDLAKQNNLQFFSLDHTDIAKGIATVLILIAHIGDKSGLRYFTPLGGIGVSVFLICSGYGLYKSYIKNGLEEFWKRRLPKILIPYWIVVIVCYITGIIENGTEHIVLGLSLIRVTGIFWYVQYIMICYIVFYIIHKYVKEKYIVHVLFGLSVASIFCVDNLLLGEQSVSFIVGIILGKYYTKRISGFNAYAIAMALFAVGIINLGIKQFEVIRNSGHIILNINGIFLKTSIALGVFYFIYPLLSLKLINVFKIAGKFSYEIYLVHLPLVFMLIGNYNIKIIIMYLLLSLIGVLILYKFEVSIIYQLERQEGESKCKY